MSAFALSRLAALAAAGTVFLPDAPRARGGVWVGRKRPRRAVGEMFFRFAGRKVTAPHGYAFNHRGDLINLRKRAKYRRAA